MRISDWSSDVCSSDLSYANDSTAFIKLSVSEVQKSLLEAILLVILVMFVFLQSWRAVLIPAIAVPVVLLGTFGIFYLLGFSINTLTLFGLTLAIGDRKSTRLNSSH